MSLSPTGRISMPETITVFISLSVSSQSYIEVRSGDRPGHTPVPGHHSDEVSNVSQRLWTVAAAWSEQVTRRHGSVEG